MAERKASALVLTAALAVTSVSVLAREPVSSATVQAAEATVMAVAQLPPQGQIVYRLIYRGGPFKYEKDGSVFGNRERLLPLKRRGYYREYTVDTPGARNRGARRIVCGGPVQTPVDCYYTSDHYVSFKRLVEAAQ